MKNPNKSTINHSPKETSRKNSKKVWLIGVVALGLALWVCTAPLAGMWQRFFGPELGFPDIATENLDETQIKIVEITKQEWQAQPDGKKYSDGFNEPWCADFVSWVMKQVDRRFTNPHSGYWRIPGVHTLAEYYQSIGKWEPFGDYQPKTGDVVIYKDFSLFGGHTNIVLSLEDGYLTTVGGNENNRIRVQKHTFDSGLGIRGFGKL